MSVRVEGNLDFQRWYWDEYHDVSVVVPLEVYSEYLDYKEECGEQNKQQLLLFLLIVGVVLIPIVYTVNIFLVLLVGGLVMGVLFSLLHKTESPETTSKDDESKSVNDTSGVVNECFRDVDLEVNNLKVLFDVKEKVVRDLILERFTPPQMTYDKFNGMVDSCKTYFYNQTRVVEDVIQLANEDTPRIRSELDGRVKNMKLIIGQIEDLIDELIISNNSVGVDDSVEVLLDDMEYLIESVKTY